VESKGSISFLNTRNKKLFEAGFRVLQRRRLTDKKLLCLPLVFLISMAGTGLAKADPFPLLSEAAIPVRLPQNVLLIGIANAGPRLVAVGEHGVIIYSDDNGQSWHQAEVPVRVTLTCIAFATPEIGWAAGDYGVVLHTQDGGLTWQTQITGTQVNQLMLADATQFATANPTADSAQRALRRANIFMGAGPDKPFLSIIATSPQSAEIFGAYRMTILTSDAGKTWADGSLQVGDPVSHNLYDAIWADGALYIAGESGTVLRSADGGKNFTLLPAPSGTTLFGVLDAGGGAVLAYGVAGALFRSTDNGQSWSPVNIAVQSNLTSGLVLKSGNILLASETGGVYLSTDHGASFSAVASQPMGIFGLAQAANGDIVFIGTSGVRAVPLSSLN
jgi:photosystem II stability/assembly factor-like uncharacterized protein